jgi:hypothetical protein
MTPYSRQGAKRSAAKVRLRLAASFLPLALGVVFASSTGPSLAAGTAYGVDTAEVGEAGGCKVEAWTAWARNRDGFATLSPSCIISNMPRTELVIQSTRGRADEEWYSTVSPYVKFNLIPTAIGKPGFALVGGAVYDAVNGQVSSVFMYLPATLRLSEVMRINTNAGWLQDRVKDRPFVTYGVGWDWLFIPKFSMTLEMFGQLNGQDLGSETRPRFQGGIRFRPVDEISFDLIYGRNVNGEGSHWITFSTAYRFKAF